MAVAGNVIMRERSGRRAKGAVLKGGEEDMRKERDGEETKKIRRQEGGS